MLTIGTLTVSLLAGLLCLTVSLVSSPSYGMLVSVALVSAVAHFASGVFFIRYANARAKWLLLALSIPVLMLSIDSVGRALSLLGLPSFRL